MLPILSLSLTIAISFSAIRAHAQSSAGLPDTDWPSYLGGPDSGQYSALAQIHRENVSTLEVAWTYSAGGSGPGIGSQIQCNPIIIDGTLYGTSPDINVFALDAATGKERWVFDPSEYMRGRSGLGVNRGVAYWSDGTEKRILATAGSSLFALDAETGQLREDFGEGGRVDLHDGLDREVGKLFVSSNTPGIIFENLLILGTRVSEGLPAAPGHIRAYDVRSGAIVWVFHTIPQPGEFGYDTWPTGAYQRTGGANAWAGMSVDHERGVVYAPTGSAAFDFYGGDRAGANLFANSLLALDAKTGKRIWHYQVVHHDLWDRDLPAPPNLVTLQRDGRAIEAVAQITKSGHVFIFDRATGEPFFPIEEKPYPSSDLPGEAAWPTQPLPTKPPAFARQRLTEEGLTNISEASRAFALERLRRSRSDGQFVPPSREGTIIYPSFDGGGEWGGAAVDPKTGIMYVNSSEMAWILTMVPTMQKGDRRVASAGRILYGRHCLYCHGIDRIGDPEGEFPSLLNLAERLPRAEAESAIRKEKGRMPGFDFLSARQMKSLLAYLYDSDEESDSATEREPALPYSSTGYNRFRDPDGYPAVKPPWGTLNAIDLNKGEILWKVPLGEYPELTARGIPITGTELYGGPAVTAGGLIFIAASRDERFRAFDTETGKMLWETQLPAGGYATPSVYAVNGKQYVVIAAGGGKMGTKPGDAYVAYTLPQRKPKQKRD
jgi:quinoprotein glucose dehydrogenase